MSETDDHDNHFPGMDQGPMIAYDTCRHWVPLLLGCKLSGTMLHKAPLSATQAAHVPHY